MHPPAVILHPAVMETPLKEMCGGNCGGVEMEDGTKLSELGTDMCPNNFIGQCLNHYLHPAV